MGGLYVDVVPDRERLARYGLQIDDVHEVVETALGGLPVTTTVEGRRRFTVNVRYAQDYRTSLEALGEVLVAVPMGAAAEATAEGAMGADGAGRPAARGEVLQLPLRTLADIRVTSGPPMIRDEAGMLVGYVYVDLQAGHDVGSYVDAAKAAVARAQASGALSLPTGMYVKWSGQYELLAEMEQRMKVLVPIALLLTMLLLYLQFGNFTEVLIVLLSVPFALVGSVWALWLLDYELSTAVWVGVIALVGLAAQTGVVMIVYIDQAYERRRVAGLIRGLEDIIEAHAEGTIQRVRPKLMTVGTMLFGLTPLLWAEGSGADVMKRIAAPMVGGLVTSAFLTLEIIPVIYTYWRYEQLVWAELARVDPTRLGWLRTAVLALQAGVAVLLGVALAWLYLELAPAAVAFAAVIGGGLAASGVLAYGLLRRRMPALEGHGVDPRAA